MSIDTNHFICLTGGGHLIYQNHRSGSDYFTHRQFGRIVAGIGSISHSGGWFTHNITLLFNRHSSI
jgi:hypothetical protein